MIASLKHAELLSLGPAALAGKAAEFNAEKTVGNLFAIFVDNAGDLPGRKALAGLMQEARTAETLALFSPPRGQKVPPKFGEADAEGGPQFWAGFAHHRRELIGKHGAVIVHDDRWLDGSPPTLAFITTNEDNTLTKVAAKVNMKGAELKSLNHAYLQSKGVDGVKVATILPSGWPVWCEVWSPELQQAIKDGRSTRRWARCRGRYGPSSASARARVSSSSCSREPQQG